MKLFRVLILAVALIAGGIAAMLALNIQPGAPAPTVVELAPQIQTQDVLVAAADIGQGESLTAENVRWQSWPEEAANAAYIKRQASPEAITELQGSVVRSQFIAGEPIRHVKLARPESGFLSAILPSGKRAIAVNVSAQSTAGGFILPNDRVDVIQTTTQQLSPDMPAQTVSRTILTNVKVLAIDQTVEEQSGEAVVVGKTATLELAPEQVELIAAAETTGSLSLALRSIADTAGPVVAAGRPAEPPAEVQSRTVRVFRNGRMQELTLGIAPDMTGAGDLPGYDPQAHCRDVALAGGGFSETIYAECLEQEQSNLDELQSSWSALPSSIQERCREAASSGGVSSYAVLRSCVEQENTAAADGQAEQVGF